MRKWVAGMVYFDEAEQGARMTSYLQRSVLARDLHGEDTLT